MRRTNGNSKRIQSTDRPFMTFPLYPEEGAQRGSPIARLNVRWDYDLYVAAKTVDVRQKANERLTTVAESQWRWDPSSAIDQQTLDFPAGQAARVPTVVSGWANTSTGAPASGQMYGPGSTKRFNTLVGDNAHWFKKVD